MTQRAWEYGVFGTAFFLRLALSTREKKHHGYCGEALTLYLQVVATITILCVPVSLFSVLFSNISKRVPRLDWYHPWVARARAILYVILIAAFPSCFLSELILRFWKIK
jgi:hypothetical protein